MADPFLNGIEATLSPPLAVRGIEAVLAPPMVVLGIEATLELLPPKEGKRTGFQGPTGFRAIPEFGFDPAEG